MQHDVNYGTAAVARGNLTKALLWDVNDETDIAHASAFTAGYNTNGSAVFSRDPLGNSGRQVTASYTDSFSSNGAESVTDPDGYSASSRYNYDLGIVTRQQDPKGAGTNS